MDEGMCGWILVDVRSVAGLEWRVPRWSPPCRRRHHQGTCARATAQSRRSASTQASKRRQYGLERAQIRPEM